MSALAAAVCLGPAGVADGAVKVVSVVGHLYVGGSAAWEFRRVDAPGSGRDLRFASHGYDSFWLEVAGAFAALYPEAHGREASFREPARDELIQLAGLAGALGVGALVALDDSSSVESLSDLHDVPGWSVRIAAPHFERSFSRWGTTDTRLMRDT